LEHGTSGNYIEGTSNPFKLKAGGDWEKDTQRKGRKTPDGAMFDNQQAPSREGRRGLSCWERCTNETWSRGKKGERIH